ncbi:hypothetical protein Q5752_004551 [Cryptotrichosporon argae]
MGAVRDRIETVFWGRPPKDAKERRLLVKLDLVILSYVSLATYLDRANLANAYVSGMKEDVDFQGNDYTYAGSMFTAGYIIGQWPSALILSSGRVPPRVWFPFCVFAWGLLTLGLAFVTTPHQVWGIRFVQALFEASTFSGTHYILGSWYKDHELGKRTAIFTSAAQLGTLFSGLMQGAIISTLDGHSGKAGWQWLFIIDAILTIPIAAYGFLMFPDTPQTVKAFWLSEDERALCLSRLPPTPHAKLTMGLFTSSLKRIVSTWRFYLFTLLFTISATSFEKVGVYSEFSLWLKAAGYATELVDYYPCIFTAVAVVGTYVLTVWTDATGQRFAANAVMYASVALSAILLLAWNIGDGGHFFAYCVGGLGYGGQAINFAWANTMCRDDEVLRAITLSSMNLFSNVWALWYGIVCWPVVSAPKFRNGQIATLVTGAAGVAIAAAIVYCSRRFPPALPSEDEIAAHRAEGGYVEDAEGEKAVEAVAVMPARA